MICKNCNAEIDDSSVFCINCGTPIETEPEKPQQPAYQQPVYQQPQQPAYQQQPVYQQQPAYQQQPVYQQPVYDENYEEETAPITRVGQYVGWFFLMCIPIVGFPILAIVFACIRNKNNKNRANFFAAIWAFLGILLAIAAFVAVLAGLFMLLMNM